MNRKMKSIVFVCLFVFAVSSLPAYLYAAESKVAYADIVYIFDNYNKTKEQNKILEDQRKKMQQDREQIVAQIKKMKDEIDLLSQSAKEKKQAEIDNKIKQLQEFEQKSGMDLKQQYEAVLKGISKEIKDVVEKYAKDNNYSMLLDARGLLYGQKQDDITETLLQQLNGAAPAKAKK